MSPHEAKILSNLVPVPDDRRVGYLEGLCAMAARARSDEWYGLKDTPANRALILTAKSYPTSEEARDNYEIIGPKQPKLLINIGTLASYFLYLLGND